jgi:hypothetical protein
MNAMKKQISIVCLVIIGLVFLFFVGLYVSLIFSNGRQGTPSVYYRLISIGDQFSISIVKEFGGYVALFNHEVPYRGSMIGGEGKNIKITGWGGYGIYYTSVRRATAKPTYWWTLMISIWYPIVIFGVILFLCIIHYVDFKRPSCRITVN